MTTPHDASLLDVSPDAQGTRVGVPAGLGFVVADAVVVQSVTAGAAGFRASLRCVSWPVQLELFRGTLPARATSSMATMLCESYAEKHADGPLEVSLASAAQLRAWGVDAAAFTLYARHTPDGGLDHEECLYLLAGTVGWRIVKRFDAARVTPVAWHAFSTSLDATLGWAGARAAGAPVDSAFVDDQMRLKAEAITFAEELARWLAASGVALNEVASVSDALRAAVYDRDPPDAQVEPPSLELLQGALAHARAPALREALQATLRRQVATWRDLRGMQILLDQVARALGMLAPTPVRCDCGAILRPGEPDRSGERLLDLAAYRSLRGELDALARVAPRWTHPARSPRRQLLLRCTLDPLEDAVSQHRAACPLEQDVVAPFGARKVGCGTRRNFFPPPEVDRIERGGYCEFVGLHVNEGLATWCAFDVVRGVAVKVERFSGRYLAHAPTVSAPTATRYARETQSERGAVRDIVTYRALAGRPLAQLVALSNVLWETEPPQPPLVFDVYNRIELRDGLDDKALGGMCNLDGTAGRIERLLQSLFV